MECKLPNGRKMQISILLAPKKPKTKKSSVVEVVKPEPQKSLLDLFQTALFEVQKNDDGNQRESLEDASLGKRQSEMAF